MLALPDIPVIDARGLSPAVASRLMPRQLEELMRFATRR
jgi:hypothetical protein